MLSALPVLDGAVMMPPIGGPAKGGSPREIEALAGGATTL
jgi:hypothetical protein